MTDQPHIHAERILQHHQERPYLNDPHTRPTLRDVIPELDAEPWYHVRWYVLVGASLSVILMSLGLYGVLEAISAYWQGW